jgi:hypothetical protein
MGNMAIIRSVHLRYHQFKRLLIITALLDIKGFRKAKSWVLYPPFREIFFKNLMAAQLMGGYDFIT